MRKRLDDLKGAWADELPSVLWSIRTTEKESTGHTPFNLVYGSRALLPIEARLSTLRNHEYEPSANQVLQKESLDFLEEVRDQARTNLVVSQNRMRRAYGRRVNKRELQENDLVLKKSKASGKENVYGKLLATWEGPYKVIKVLQPGTYRLSDLDGNELHAHWNAGTLKKYFI
ncbi:hypothetical protein vseg_010674 [Gypsophila vaccaria]